ncbi:MAG: glycosyltransferase [Acidimicrobiales bacterium]
MARVIARMNVGGPARQVVGLTRGLDPGRFEQRLFIGRVGPEEADYLELRAPDVAFVRVRGLGRSPQALDDVRALGGLIAELRRFRPHILHTHTAKAGALGRVAARAARVPGVVHTFHGHLLRGYFSPSVTRAVVLAERALATSSTRLVAVGRQVRDDLLAAGIGSPGNFVVVAPGLDLPTPPSRPEARHRLRLPGDARVVAFVARLTAVKRPDRFAEVALEIAKDPNLADVIFVVAGEGPSLPELRSRLAPLGDRVRFLGWRADVETVYAAADVVVLTSDNEGMPVSLIEAALAGCPAVTTDVGSAAEVVCDGVTGVVCPPRVGDLVAGVTGLLGDASLMLRMGAAARDRAGQEFSTARLVADTERLYEDIAIEKGFG